MVRHSRFCRACGTNGERDMLEGQRGGNRRRWKYYEGWNFNSGYCLFTTDIK